MNHERLTVVEVTVKMKDKSVICVPIDDLIQLHIISKDFIFGYDKRFDPRYRFDMKSGYKKVRKFHL
jgi:hypothetical protein